MKLLKIFDIRKAYFLHLLIILGALFLTYNLGNNLLTFSGIFGGVKMFLWFYIIFYLVDNITEAILDIK